MIENTLIADTGRILFQTQTGETSHLLHQLIASAQRSTASFSELLLLLPSERAFKTAVYDISSDDPLHYVETLQRYFGDFATYFAALRESVAFAGVEG